MKVVTVVGARPQFIKASAVSRILRQTTDEVLVHTGQHYDTQMSDVFFAELGLPHPDYNLGVGSGNHGRQMADMLTGLEDILLREKPDWLLVYGDTNSTLAGALAAAKLQIPIAHVEAGLRSYNRQMPEEINRVLTDHLSTLLFCPTAASAGNLAKEGITAGVYVVGDVMYDAMVTLGSPGSSDVLERFHVKPGEYILLTIHRARNTDDPVRLGNILRAVGSSDGKVVFPIHPRTRARIKAFGLENLLQVPPFHVSDPLSYLEMITLERHAARIVTDSGGVQKEAHMLGVLCITCREETEWVESVQAGGNVLVGADPDRIRAALVQPISSRPPAVDSYGDGKAAERLISHLLACKPKG